MLALKTLWFNTGTLCNITCRNCYIESSPKNDRLVYLGVNDIQPYLDEISRDDLGTEEIGFTGGEPFMNPNIIELLKECLLRGFCVLVLTNAMKPMRRWSEPLIDLKERYGHRLKIRVSLDHYAACRHEEERGVDTFAPTKDGLIWLTRNGFNIAVAGRAMWRRIKQLSAPDTRACLQSTIFRSMPTIRGSSSCSLRWTSASMCPRSRPDAGTSLGSRPPQ